MMLHVSRLLFDMNSFFASAAQAEELQLIGRPVGVLTTDAPGAACIAASIEAKRCRVGMGTRQATVRFGQPRLYRGPYTGAKFAFGRIPVKEDFQE
ncbi:MAG: hypothetical protein R3D56_12470 [Paracoccaceae bacterium]